MGSNNLLMGGLRWFFYMMNWPPARGMRGNLIFASRTPAIVITLSVTFVNKLFIPTFSIKYMCIYAGRFNFSAREGNPPKRRKTVSLNLYYLAVISNHGKGFGNKP